METFTGGTRTVNFRVNATIHGGYYVILPGNAADNYRTASSDYLTLYVDTAVNSITETLTFPNNLGIE